MLNTGYEGGLAEVVELGKERSEEVKRYLDGTLTTLDNRMGIGF